MPVNAEADNEQEWWDDTPIMTIGKLQEEIETLKRELETANARIKFMEWQRTNVS